MGNGFRTTSRILWNSLIGVCEERSNPSAGWDGLIAGYHEARASRGLSPTALIHQRRSLELWRKFATSRGILDPGQVTPSDLTRFLALGADRRVGVGYRRGLFVKPTTVRVWWRDVRGFFGWLVRQEHILFDPTILMDPMKVRRGFPRILTLDEVDRLLGAPHENDPISLRDGAMLELLYSSGLRSGELLGLDIIDLDLGQGEVSLRRTKGGKNRRVPMGPPAVRALLRYLQDGRDSLIPSCLPEAPCAVFLSRAGTRLRADLMELAFRLRARQAGIRGRVTPHSLRHTAAVHLLKGGADIRSIQDLLGHSSVETTVHYTRQEIEDLKLSLARAHPRSRMRV